MYMELTLKDKNYINKLLNKYETKEISDFQRLKELDRKATFNSKMFAYIFGTISCLIFGFGMCVAMKQILNIVCLVLLLVLLVCF